MVENRKRKAADQLSPYTKDTDEQKVLSNLDELSTRPVRKRAVSRIKKLPNGEGSTLRGLLSNIDILTQPVNKDHFSGLNRSFLRAVTLVINKQSNKSLLYLFKQYEQYYSTIFSNEKANVSKEN